MLKISVHLTTAVFIATALVILQTTASNLIWLSSLDMPVSLQVGLTTYFNDLITMNYLNALPVPRLQTTVPFFALIAVALFIAFFFARVGLNWIRISKRLAYSLAGGAAIIGIVILMPLEFYNLDLLPGARTFLGKMSLGACGMVSGFYFGSSLKERKSQ